ncbi:T-complex protein 1 [Lactarius akahatsu]|uniref:CCT-theta n=1 Tax=Lactarius akahatsu TaxID=416441 RepID=A0AAD4QC71_9AGAM|nr:T-complex protein 1 [Lactarius akahatsu]
MALKVPKANNIQLFKDGYKQMSGLEDAVLRNIEAVSELSNLVRTSFGPNGRNKLVINHLGKLFVTSDAATIIREIEVVHPAAKLLVMASQAQESEMGDATNTVLILSGELLKRAESLLVMGLHPSEVIKGYELACAKALTELETLSTSELPSPLTKQALAHAVTPAIASKQYGSEDILARLVAEAALLVMPENKTFNVDNVRVVKIMGGSLAGSKVVQGMVFGREPEGDVKKVTGGKVAVFTNAIDVAQTETKGTVLIKNADDMLNFTRGEEKHMEKIFKELADSGVKAIIAGTTVGELALHYLNRNQILVLKVLSKFDLRRLCRVVQATPLARLGAPTPEEAGYVDVCETIEIGGDRVTVLRQEPDGAGVKTRTATIVLRGATQNHLDDLERAVDDGVASLKALLKDPRLVPGAGATELALARRVDTYGAGLRGLAQHAVRRFASALEVIPRTLAENAHGGAEGNEIVARLLAKHEKDGGESWGVDVEAETDGTVNVTERNIVDSLAAKAWAIRLATEAAVSVLSVDSIIMSRPAGGPKIPQQAGNWDED